nr:hypothetical protein [Tanacetum cinerariifolium]
MNYLEEHTDGEAMINSIKNGDQPLPRVTQVSIAGTTSTKQPPLKDKSMCNKTAKDLWDALARHMLGFEYGEQDRKAVVLSKKKTVVVTSDPLALIAKKTNVSRSKEKVVVSSDSEGKASSSSADEKIYEVSYYLSESESESEFETSEYYDNSTNYGLFVNNDDDQEIFHDATESASENFIENHIDSQKDYDKSDKRVEKANQQSKDFENQNKDLQEKYDVLINQVNAFEEKNNEFNDQIKVLNEKNNDLLAQTKLLKDQLQVKLVVIDTRVECQEKYAKLEAERYEYMIKYSAYFDNDKQHRKQIANQQVLFDKISVQIVELDKHVRDLKNTMLEKDFKISELEECVRNKDLKIEKCLERLNVCENKLHKMGQTNQTVHMIMPSKDNLYNVISLGYTLMFLTYSDEALEIEKFKRSRENKIEFAYDYGNLNASYVNEKINFEDDYFQEIINPDFKKIDSLFQQTSSLKPYVPNKIKNDCQVVEKECDNVENSKVIAPEMFKLSVSQSVSPISVTKTSCALNGVESNAFDCNNARNALGNARMNASVDVNDLFVFDDIQVAQKKVKKAFENSDSSSRVELIPSKINDGGTVVGGGEDDDGKSDVWVWSDSAVSLRSSSDESPPESSGKDLVCLVILIHLLIISDKATSAKITISAEATSPDNHMFAVDRWVNIKSGRDWFLSTDMVVSDAWGNAIHCSARSNVAHNFIKLKEEVIYCIKNFMVHPNKEECRISKDDAFMLEFNRATSAQKSLAKDKLYLSSSSSTQIFNDLNILVLKELRSEISITDQTKQIMPVDFGEPRASTLENFQLYRLELGIFDATMHVAVVMFDETASELVKYSADSLAQSKKR